ncbi:MAG: 23S rRNA (guanosine(2251)-2'-O)-methyltransferase RlmB [Desulfuromonadales bacterium]|nr:23S rRNA (guanosine(2251)-2'-O)-methyltransferase RlmB [Desulfuromonadales bacterium]
MADYLYGINPVSEALTGQGRKPQELIVVRGKQSPRLDELLEQAHALGVPVSRRERRELDRVAGHDHHQGVLLRLEPFAYADLGDLLQRWQQSGRPAFFLLLDGVTDPHNLGAILRSAEVAGCHGVILAKDRSCPVTPVVEKTAAGALCHLPLCQVTNLARTLEQLQKENIWCYGLAGEEGALPLYRSDLRGNIALVVGSEGKGLRPNVRKHCDGLLAIPMRGRIGSLNASVAAAVALFEVVRQAGQGEVAG